MNRSYESLLTFFAVVLKMNVYHFFYVSRFDKNTYVNWKGIHTLANEKQSECRNFRYERNHTMFIWNSNANAREGNVKEIASKIKCEEVNQQTRN